jgi:hypothetical protein
MGMNRDELRRVERAHALLGATMENEKWLEVVRGYEERISKLGQRVFMLEKVMQDALNLGVPHYGIHCKRVLEQVHDMLFNALHDPDKKTQQQTQ